VTVPDTVSPMNNTRVTAQKVIHMVFSLERSTRSSGFSFTRARSLHYFATTQVKSGKGQ
jgi:hypothetical protein